MLKIREATIQDIESLMHIYEIARETMRQSGNPHQWGANFPPRELIEEDIEKHRCMAVCEGDAIHGAFALCRGEDPTYGYVEGGEWLNDASYVTMHRVASDAKVHGLFAAMVNYCKSISDNVRIDTHEDNQIMHKVIMRNGFVKCGIIYLLNGEPRVAYHWAKYRIGQADAGDKEKILALYQMQLGRECCAWDDQYPGMKEIEFDLSRDALFVMKDEMGEIVASISIDEDDAVKKLTCWKTDLQPGGELARLAVHPALQNKGIAREMLKHGMRELKKRGYQSVHFLVNKGNQKALRSYAVFQFPLVGECEMFGQPFFCYESKL
ncbi:GNAT family N-acetyltransferase [Kineothrix sp. MSJ-39]|uniref:GNAT family N-acetyltransferase n=1 Tax=Kineothrix sp. MSJ-39 TaxID=2841533 RepID=UPI00209FA33E|nr:GNAT family N-acetyltransferase [Kineothrix sp. MSJ-39]